MEIFKAIVEPYLPGSLADPSIINATRLPAPNPIKVRYTTPNHQRYFYGFYAPPAVGSEILVAYEKEIDEYYYLSTVVNHSIDLGSISKDSEGNPAPLFSQDRMVDSNGNPANMFFKNDRGAGLNIGNFYSETKVGNEVLGVEVNNSVELKSTKKKKLMLNDTPGAECVVLANEDGDGITIGGDVTVPYKLTGTGIISRGISINSLNSQQCIVSHGEYKVEVNEGRDVHISNNSIGLYRGPAALQAAANAQPPVGWLGVMDPLNLFGNINLKSKYRDINISTGDSLFDPFLVTGRTSSIYLHTKWGFVQIVAGVGGIKIINKDPLSPVTVQSAGSVKVLAQTGDINLNAPAGAVNILARQINMKATTTLNAEGMVSTNIGSTSPLNLNSGVPVTIIPTIPTIPTANVFGN